MIKQDPISKPNNLPRVFAMYNMEYWNEYIDVQPIVALIMDTYLDGLYQLIINVDVNKII